MDEEMKCGGMTDAQLAVFLRTLAELIKCKAKSAQEAAAIIRETAESLIQSQT